MLYQQRAFPKQLPQLDCQKYQCALRFYSTGAENRRGPEVQSTMAIHKTQQQCPIGLRNSILEYFFQ